MTRAKPSTFGAAGFARTVRWVAWSTLVVTLILW